MFMAHVYIFHVLEVKHEMVVDAVAVVLGISILYPCTPTNHSQLLGSPHMAALAENQRSQTGALQSSLDTQPLQEGLDWYQKNHCDISPPKNVQRNINKTLPCQSWMTSLFLITQQPFK